MHGGSGAGRADSLPRGREERPWLEAMHLFETRLEPQAGAQQPGAEGEPDWCCAGDAAQETHGSG